MSGIFEPNHCLRQDIDALEAKIVIYIEPSPKYASRVKYFVSLELLVGSR